MPKKKSRLPYPAVSGAVSKSEMYIESNAILLKAWKKLLLAYASATMAGLVAGVVLNHMFGLQPDTIHSISSKRISYAFPVFEFGLKNGIDLGLLLFVWNSLAALASISLIHAGQLFNPDKTALFPQRIRKAFCGKTKMKLLCLLPGCLRIKEEPLRRLYVWLMIPFLGMILLGLETGLSISTAARTLGSVWVGIVSFLPHGLVEIPGIAMAGAVAFSAHLIVKDAVPARSPKEIFELTAAHKNRIPLKKIVLGVIGSLLAAGFIEAHVTRRILESLLNA